MEGTQVPQGSIPHKGIVYISTNAALGHLATYTLLCFDQLQIGLLPVLNI